MMADIVYITATIVFFVICFLFARGCDTVFHSGEHERRKEDMPVRVN